MTDFDKALQLDPKCAWAYCGRGVTYAKKGDFDKAIVDYTEAIRLAPKLAKTYYSRGLVYKEMGEADKAKADFTEAEKLGYNPQTITR